MPNLDPRIIEASPTKDFFISMLIKDIGLSRAIIDLVDNSVDGARRIRQSGNYNGLWVEIEVSKQFFKITDNCGGMGVELARDYAFRFGRPSDMEPTPHSVGQFGVGMKRAIFKLGRKFRIESKTSTSRFVVEEDVDDWKEEKEWQFRFKELEEDRRFPSSETGTRITVKALHEAVAESFELDTFKSRLVKELQEAHIETMQNGLDIKFNEIAIQHHGLVLLNSRHLRPAHIRMAVGSGPSRMNIRLYAGIGDSNPSAAGWYIFCNGRLVLAGDQTSTTGWGESVPRYHNQFARFRGYAFFDSRDASLLPWNTTKTGVDADSPKFRSVRLEMIKMMRPVITFLNHLDAEKSVEVTDAKPLEAAVTEAKSKDLTKIDTRATFLAPKSIPKPEAAQSGRIQYSKPLKEIRLVQQALKVRTLGQVGEKTFEYFFKRECES